jgi:predicted nucleic acid-binding protein
MIVIDSCVWIHAFLRTDTKCTYILETIFNGDVKPIISAYLAKN